MPLPSQIYKEFKSFGQKYYRKKVINPKTERNNSILICGQPNCLKEFKKKCNMLDHLRTHSGLKPFSCTHCSMSFKQRAQLSKHMQVHSAGQKTRRNKKKWALVRKKTVYDSEQSTENSSYQQLNVSPKACYAKGEHLSAFQQFHHPF